MNKDVYLIENGKFVKATKWKLFKRDFKNWFKKWKLVNSSKFRIIPLSEIGRFFELTAQEKKDAEKIYKEKGTISYEFYPCGGIGWGVRVHLLDNNNKIINITDYNNW